MTELEMRCTQNYATNHVVNQPMGFATPGELAAAVKLWPFAAWPEGELGTPTGHGARRSPTYYTQGTF